MAENKECVKGHHVMGSHCNNCSAWCILEVLTDSTQMESGTKQPAPLDLNANLTGDEHE